MKVVLNLVVDVDPEALDHYRAAYFRNDTAVEILAREAIAAWDFEGFLIAPPAGLESLIYGREVTP